MTEMECVIESRWGKKREIKTLIRVVIECREARGKRARKRKREKWTHGHGKERKSKETARWRREKSKRVEGSPRSPSITLRSQTGMAGVQTQRLFPFFSFLRCAVIELHPCPLPLYLCHGYLFISQPLAHSLSYSANSLAGFLSQTHPHTHTLMVFLTLSVTHAHAHT